MRSAPDQIDSLKKNQCFVFGSNGLGEHGKGAALAAFGEDYHHQRKQTRDAVGKWAVWGKSRGFMRGHEGMSYAIETKADWRDRHSLPLPEIEKQIDKLIKFAERNPSTEFLCSAFGAGLAGRSHAEMAKLWQSKTISNNLLLPPQWVEELSKLGETKVAKQSKQSDQYEWARYCPEGRQNYECSSKGDRRFSALNAQLSDGRTIEEAYQLDVKGYRKQGDDWRLGKGKPPLRKLSQDQLYEEYKGLWQQWAEENPSLMAELAKKAKGKVLTDQFASTSISQACALTELLNEGYGRKLAQSKAIASQQSDTAFNPLANLKPLNNSVATHMEKDIAMAEVATQFIGKSSAPTNVPSSTRNYQKAWAEIGLANTGRYTSNDVIMVSGSGRGVALPTTRFKKHSICTTFHF
jgi:hypothetical protein